MLLSVIMCCFNGDNTVKAAIDSIYNQSLNQKEFELIFVNDGSTDHTLDAIKPYTSHDSFKLINNPKNLGLSASCNIALKNCASRYVMRIDADDYIDSNLFSKLISTIDIQKADLVICNHYEVISATNQKRIVQLDVNNIFSYIACGTLMKTSILKKIGGYQNLFWEEYDLYIRYLQESNKIPAHVQEPLYSYNKHSQNMTSDKKEAIRGWDELRSKWSNEILSKFGKIPKNSLL
jgi:glycosyltransferase involved in cell wall biosynthesis